MPSMHSMSVPVFVRMLNNVLAWLDKAGVFPNAPHERRIELLWPSALPENEEQKLAELEAKARLGVPREVLLRELGYPADER